MRTFEKYESNVRSYCRYFNDVFVKAKGSLIYGESGKEYIDFFAGAGALNYGHNPEFIKDRLIEHIQRDGVSHGLDMYTDVKRRFIDYFVEHILEPRGLDYKLQFCGATGTNAVEAALKLARKVKKRTNVFSFMGAFHGMSLGSLAATSNRDSREGAGTPLNNVTFMPHPSGPLLYLDTIEYMERVLSDDHSGIDKPAAIIFETVQAEGGINPVSEQWLRALADLCVKHDILLICDDIQVGCGRTGTFFSFERAGIVPDMVTLSKSISGYGLPMSLLLLKPELDQWKPGEHNGTFRGNQMAFVTAMAALELREMMNLDLLVKQHEHFIRKFLETNIKTVSDKIEIRGTGMIWGIDLSNVEDSGIPKQIVKECFANGLILETAGREDQVIKILPPLTIEQSQLERGFKILNEAVHSIIAGSSLLTTH
ncbi:diaminobutyrate--2-oxoglutarate transaminase [Paenibacillus cellulosilyticus]|uniref:diaminobutyrate--2-oxoglutarate transaminase n=1 Tax=Paenibacillus cellulosilyticus TaxID=375489 RepID=UPI000D717E70|nr:diaminobutyrate--2-oxoglutarate transaminase [Paenibacillus cellulosilyticus]QKS46622.1 diaminobutyrate--2-oxoglutarate transaminase [Paenibacillus cellulosilyticus]